MCLPPPSNFPSSSTLNISLPPNIYPANVSPPPLPTYHLPPTVPLQHYLLILLSQTHQLGPRYEGQLMSDGRAYFPFRSILLVLTHDFIITCVYGPTGSDEHERKDADAALRTIFVPFEVKGVLYAWGPVQPANGPPTRTTSG